MRKMIAFQKMLITMLFPTCYGNGNKVKSAVDENLLILYSVSVFLALIRISSSASMIGFILTLFLFLYRILVRHPFIFQLPVKRIFTINGLYIFNCIFTLFVIFAFWGIVFLFVIFVSIILFFFNRPMNFSFIDTVTIQEQILVFSFSLLYINVLTPTLLLKRKTARIIGMTAVSALYFIFTVILGAKISDSVFAPTSLGHYLQHISNGWQIAGAGILITVVFSFGCILLAEFTDWYGHRRFNKSATAQ